jgi:hypothetical protein
MTKPTLHQGARILELFTRLKISSQQLDLLLESGVLATFLEVAGAPEFARLDRESLRAKLGLPSQTYDYKITFLGEVTIADHDTLETMAIAAEYGGFQSHIDAIIQHKVTVRGSRRLHLVHPITHMDTNEVLRALSKEGSIEPAQVEDLMAVGLHPELRKVIYQTPIISVGSPIMHDGGERVQRLIVRMDQLWLDFASYNRTWSGPTRLLVVEKKPSIRDTTPIPTLST